MAEQDETYSEYSARMNEYYSRPEVIERLRNLPATHVYVRKTKSLRPVKQGGSD